MPELPEAETIARGLARVIGGATVTAVRVHRRDVLRGVPARQRSSRGLSDLLAGATVNGVFRRAKAIVLDAAPWRVVVTPRFTGGLFVHAAGSTPDRFDCVRWTLADGRVLAYRDVRRLGTVAVLDRVAWTAFDARLGLEPLDTADLAGRVSAVLRATERAVKVALMDQAKIAGIGNIYASEVLWAAKVDPARRGRSLTTGEATRIADAIRDILTRAITAGGTSIRDYRDSTGARGAFSSQLAVYGRAGQGCHRCGRPIRRTDAIDRRGTFFCAECQK